MKNLPAIFLIFAFVFAIQSCKKDNSDDNNLSGDPSPMSSVGTVVQSSAVPIQGVSEINATVTNLSDGISSYSGTATITNVSLKNLLSNIPGISINGDQVTASGMRFKQTVEGVESSIESGPGILVKYSSNVGDKYTVGSTGKTRTVVSKSTADDYQYGYYMIKVLQVEEPSKGLKSSSVTKTTYWANHKFGIVGVQWDFSDGSSIKFPVFSSATN